MNISSQEAFGLVLCARASIAKSFKAHSYEKFACKSFRAHSYEIWGFEVPSNHTLTKKVGGVPTETVAGTNSTHRPKLVLGLSHSFTRLSYQFVGCAPPAQCGRIGSRAFLRGLMR